MPTWCVHAAIAATCVIVIPAPAQTIVPAGPVSGVWNAAGSPYVVQGSLVVVDLQIGPDVVVRVDGPYTIEVPGRLIAQGTKAQPILFTAGNKQDPWRGLEFNDSSSDTVLQHCIVEKSVSSGIRITSTSVQGEPPLLQRCTIRDNHTPLNGGGIRANVAAGKPLVMEHCTVSGNTAGVHCVSNHVGGGLYLTGAAHIVGCVFDDNTCTGVQTRGSAMFCDGSGTVEVTASEFRRNLGVGECTLNPWSRGAVFVSSAGLEVRITNCVVTCNTARGWEPTAHGSGIWVEAGTVTITNCTIAGNEHQGVVRTGGAVTVRNSILYYGNSNGAQYSGSIAFECCDVQGEVVTGGCANISQGPNFSPSACTACEVRIPSFSPCVDKGNPDPQFNDACFVTAQLPAPYGLAHGASRNDIGAHGGPAACLWSTCYPDCDYTCALTVQDFGCFQTRFVAGQTYADCNGDGLLSVSDFGCFQTKFVLGCP